MKKRLVFSLLVSAVAISLNAQQPSNDDVYFTPKDRALMNAAKEKENEQVYVSARKELPKVEDESINPTDSYSARNVNPEYAARSNAEVAQYDDENYFSSDYNYNTASNLNSWNNNFNSQYGNPWYQNSYYCPNMYSWNSSYYGGYDPWSNIWYSPYSRPGWSSSIAFSYGSAWNYGYGSSWSMGYGNGFGYGYGYNPYSYWYNPYSSYGYGGYPVVVVERGGSNRAYGKRNSRSSTSLGNGTSGGLRSPITTMATGSRSETGSRISSGTSRPSTTTSSRQTTEHYNRTWRNQTQSQSQGGNTSSGSNSGSRTSSYEPQNNSRSRQSDFSNSGSNSSYTPSRSGNSGSSSSGSSGSRSSSGSSGSSGSSSGSHSRSRGR